MSDKSAIKRSTKSDWSPSAWHEGDFDTRAQWDKTKRPLDNNNNSSSSSSSSSSPPAGGGPSPPNECYASLIDGLVYLMQISDWKGVTLEYCVRNVLKMAIDKFSAKCPLVVLSLDYKGNVPWQKGRTQAKRREAMEKSREPPYPENYELYNCMNEGYKLWERVNTVNGVRKESRPLDFDRLIITPHLRSDFFLHLHSYMVHHYNAMLAPDQVLIIEYEDDNVTVCKQDGCEISSEYNHAHGEAEYSLFYWATRFGSTFDHIKLYSTDTDVLCLAAFYYNEPSIAHKNLYWFSERGQKEDIVWCDLRECLSQLTKRLKITLEGFIYAYILGGNDYTHRKEFLHGLPTHNVLDVLHGHVGPLFPIEIIGNVYSQDLKTVKAKAKASKVRGMDAERRSGFVMENQRNGTKRDAQRWHEIRAQHRVDYAPAKSTSKSTRDMPSFDQMKVVAREQIEMNYKYWQALFKGGAKAKIEWAELNKTLQPKDDNDNDSDEAPNAQETLTQVLELSSDQIAQLPAAVQEQVNELQKNSNRE